ncbi:MAG: CPBP family intramembrane metalloprotease [Defluviitaleaceae bacterium]|nr:CPBP family intramembrane metalloprotease [Defluviitaleaceae bacterium]
MNDAVKTAPIQPTHFKANLFMFFLVAYNMLMAATIGYLYREVWQDSEILSGFFRSPWFMVAFQVAGLLLPLCAFCAISGESLIKKTSSIKLRLQLDPKNILLIIAISIVLQPFMMLVSAIGSLFLPNPVTDLVSGLSVLPVPQALIIVAVTPAILEELVFRGFIQSHYEGHPIAITAIVNGLFFGIVHMNLHQFTYAFFMGIVFAVMVYYTKSVFAGMLGHFVVNASQYLMGYAAVNHLEAIYSDYYGMSPLDTVPDRAVFIQAIWALGLICLFILPLVVGLFYIFAKHNQSNLPVEQELDDRKYPFDIAFFGVVAIFVLLMIGMM